MKRFVLTLSAFGIVLIIVGEILVRSFKLVPDIPERLIDNNGIQKYKPNQSGFYTKADVKWNVNQDGWLGLNEKKPGGTITIIGDSYIENMMNPLECNQGYILKSKFPNFSFFEAGRSGVTFIEAMEIGRILAAEIDPKIQLIYLNQNDFYESISEIQRFPDRTQFSLEEKKLLPGQLHFVALKKVLYNLKFAYYLYLKFPIFVGKQNKEDIANLEAKSNSFEETQFIKLLDFVFENYKTNNLIFVFHPNTDLRFVELFEGYGLDYLLLENKNDKSWIFGDHDGHWSCYGHRQIGKQVEKILNERCSNGSFCLPKTSHVN